MGIGQTEATLLVESQRHGWSHRSAFVFTHGECGTPGPAGGDKERAQVKVRP